MSCSSLFIICVLLRGQLVWDWGTPPVSFPLRSQLCAVDYCCLFYNCQNYSNITCLLFFLYFLLQSKICLLGNSLRGANKSAHTVTFLYTQVVLLRPGALFTTPTTEKSSNAFQILCPWAIIWANILGQPAGPCVLFFHVGLTQYCPIFLPLKLLLPTLCLRAFSPEIGCLRGFAPKFSLCCCHQRNTHRPLSFGKFSCLSPCGNRIVIYKCLFSKQV